MKQSEIQASVVNLFPTTLFLVDDFITTKQASDACDFIKTLKLKPHGVIERDLSSHAGDSDTVTQIAQNVISCKNLKDSINASLEAYSQILGIRQNYLTNSWASIQRKGTKLKKHGHQTSVISGVLYLKTDSNSSKIYFYNPNPFVPLYVGNKATTESSFTHYWLPVPVGRLVLFPSWLLHGSNDEVNMSEERIIISFNSGYGAYRDDE